MKYDLSKGMTPQLAQLLGIPRHPEPKTWRQNILDAVEKLREELSFHRDGYSKLTSDLVKLLDCGKTANIFDAIANLRTERDDALQLREAYNSNVKDWRELCSYFNLPVSTLSDVLSEIDTMRKERDEFRTSLSELSYKNEQNVCELDAYRAGNHPDLKSQLSEIRYVLHGDIEPCFVLYSDASTTLLRLDEGDMMLETDTIEWSDSVTYRCQELLRSTVGEAGKQGYRMVNAMAQLVRDERILLNDNGGDEVVEHRCSECNTSTNGSDCCVKVQER